MDELATSKTLLQGIIDASPDAITVFEAVRNSQGQVVDMRFVMLNEQSAHVTSDLYPSVIGMLYSEVAPETYYADRFGWLRQVVETGKPFEQETHTQFPNGSSMWARVSIRRFDEYVVSTYTDITERKRTELKRAEQSALLKGVFSTALLGIGIYEPIRDEQKVIADFRLLRINEAGLQMLNFTSDIVGKTMLELYPQSKTDGLFSRYVEVCETAVPFQTEHYYPGFNRWYAIAISKTRDSVMVTYQDITERKHAERLIRRQADRFNGILSSMMNGLVVFEIIRDEAGKLADLRYEALSSSVLRDVGRSAEQLVGHTLLEVFPGAKSSRYWTAYEAVASTGEPQQFEDHYQYDGINNYTYAQVVQLDRSHLISSYQIINDIKRAEQALQQQSDLLQNIFENPLTGTIVFETVTNPMGAIVDFRYRLFNQTALRLAGMTNEQLNGRLASEVGYVQRGKGLFERLVAVWQTGESQRFEQYFEGKDVWRDMALAKLQTGIVLKFNDITDRKRAERDRQQQANLLQTVIDNAPVGIILAEAMYDDGQLVDFRYQLTNRFNAGTMGYTVEDMTGRAISELFPGWQSLQLFTDLKKVVETGQSFQYTDKYDSYGNLAWYEYYISKQENCALLTFLDVTRLIQAQLKQQEQANLLQAVIDNSPTGIVLYRAVRNADGRIVDFTYELTNPANNTITGSTNSELIGSLMLELNPVNRETGHFDNLVQVVETGHSMRRLLDYRAYGINGWFDAQYVKQADGVLFTYLDVTESQQYRRQIETANVELLRSNDNLLQFAYVASHDLQEPLRKIQQFGDLLAGQYQHVLDRNGQNYLKRMQSSANRMSLLIKDLLAYSRLTTHREAFRPISLTTVVAEVLEDLEVRITETGATITVHDLPTLPGDEHQLRQLFQNLIGNALKFNRTSASGEIMAPVITISSQRLTSASLPDNLLAQSQVGIARTVGPWFHEISVADNGIGFDEKYLDRIFQVFQRLHTKQEFAGSGVGLAICRKVIENHSGAITASSKPGVGTTFKVYLPE